MVQKVKSFMTGAKLLPKSTPGTWLYPRHTSCAWKHPSCFSL